MAGSHWIQGAIKHPGAFTKKAKAAGMSVAGFASKIAAHPGNFSTTTRRQGALARTLRKLAKRR